MSVVELVGLLSSVAHSSLDVCSPVGWASYRNLLLSGGVAPGPVVLDVGCGKGALLAYAIELLGGRGVGVELEGGFVTEPALMAKKLEAAGKIEFVFQDAALFLQNKTAEFDLILCIGSSQALGGVEKVFVAARKHLKPGGKVLLGELVWKEKPEQALLDFLECGEEDLVYFSELRSLAEKNGFSVQQTVSCTDEEFENYEATLRRNIHAWCEENSQDSRALEFRNRSDAWWEARDKWARQAFGFDVLLAGL